MIDPSAFIAEGAKVLTITIGDNTNIQDNSCLHIDLPYPMRIGNGVTIGHGCIIHGCIIDDDSLIGMGSIIMNGAHIGKECLIGAGTLITQNTVIPDRSLVFGRPGKVIRPVTCAIMHSITQRRESNIRQRDTRRNKHLYCKNAGRRIDSLSS